MTSSRISESVARIGRAVVVLNPSSGIKREGAPEDAVRDALTATGIGKVEVLRLERRLNLHEAIAEHLRKGVEAVVAAGGDGTVSGVASVLANEDTPLGILPTGTLNHFAKDVGIPGELEEAARVISAGEQVRVDIARVNDRYFINNSSIGLYPAMVGVRERLMKQGWRKRAAMVAGGMAALWQFPNTSVRLTTEDSGLITRTPFVFIGNNRYELSGFEVGTRSGLQDGCLQVCAVRSTSRLALFRSALHALVAGANGHPEFHTEFTHQADIRTMRKHVHVALDGEVVVMNSPLRYSIDPGALRVLAPSSK